MLSIFSCVMAISMASLEKCAVRSLANFVLDFFYIELYKLFVCVGHEFFVGIFICKIFPHSDGCLFLSLMVSFAV